MRAVEIIRKKRDGEELSAEEIAFVVREYSADRIPDYQVAALLMAVFQRGMSESETALLTEAMRASGDVVDLGALDGRKVDKHSTGGVGDKTSLVLGPAVAACGVTVPMISGRGLGHTGGTLDKLESIPGFDVRLDLDRFKRQLASARLAFIGQTRSLVPADRKLYALRDVTATVESRPLIVASIMSKKLAEGIDALVLDVKTGSGAFMKRLEDSESLARAMVSIGRACGKEVVALITDMNQPLGEYAGNAHEVLECLEVMKGRGPDDLRALTEELCAWCLLLGEAAGTLEEARDLYRRSIESGAALAKFEEIIRLQGGDPAVIEDYGRLPQARHRREVASPGDGFLQSMDTEAVGLALCVLGAGRETVESVIDPAVGMRFHKRIGDSVRRGEPLATLYYNDEGRAQEAARRLVAACRMGEERAEPPVLIRRLIRG